MLFTDEQIEFIRSLGLDFDLSNLSEDDYILIEDKVGDKYNSEVLDVEDEIKDKKSAARVIKLCEDILYSPAIQG